jgi:FPC/CPF motif-containing protein YcgG
MTHTEHDRVTEMNSTLVSDLGEIFREFVGGDTFPCVGAKAALSRGSIETADFGMLGDRNDDRPMLDGISRFVTMIESNACDGTIVNSYVTIFHGPLNLNEIGFEALMWQQLWRIHKLDVLAGNRPADDVSSDADSPLFSLSIAGHPFFVIGLHPFASRIARRFSHPALVFNSHRQFEKLRDDGRYAKMQTATRSRDVQLQGSVNPNLADFGEASEARQYSGREVENAWRCPVDFKEKP